MSENRRSRPLGLEEPWSFVPIYNNMYFEVTCLCTCTYINCKLPIHTFQDRFSMPLAGSIATLFYIPVKQNQTEIWFIPDFRDHPCLQLKLNRCSLFSWPGTKIFFKFFVGVRGRCKLSFLANRTIFFRSFDWDDGSTLTLVLYCHCQNRPTHQCIAY